MSYKKLEEVTKEVLVFILVLVLASVILTGCEETREVTKPLKVSSPVVVNYQFLDHPEDVNNLYYSLLSRKTEESIGEEDLRTNKKGVAPTRWGFHYYYKGECFIVMVRPSWFSYKEFEQTLGHEMTHCLFGEFHAANGKNPTKLIIGK